MTKLENQGAESHSHTFLAVRGHSAQETTPPSAWEGAGLQRRAWCLQPPHITPGLPLLLPRTCQYPRLLTWHLLSGLPVGSALLLGGCRKQNLSRTRGVAHCLGHFLCRVLGVVAQGTKAALQVLLGRMLTDRTKQPGRQAGPPTAPAPQPPLLCGQASMGAYSIRDSQPSQTWAPLDTGSRRTCRKKTALQCGEAGISGDGITFRGSFVISLGKPPPVG